jgi:hypothetical protein
MLLLRLPTVAAQGPHKPRKLQAVAFHVRPATCGAYNPGMVAAGRHGGAHGPSPAH